VDRAALGSLASNQEYVRRLGDNPYDRFGVAHTLRVLCDIPFIRATNPGAFERFDRIARDLASAMPAPLREVCEKWQSPATHPGAKRPITGMVGRALIRSDACAEAEPLLAVAQKCVALYSAWNLEYTYFMLACRERLKGALDEQDRRIAQEAVERGRFLLQFGRSESGLAERYVGRLHQLRGEFAEAIPFLLAARPKLAEWDAVAGDQALVISYLKTGQVEKARKLVKYGIEHGGVFAEQYRRMIELIPK
jgi:hypothetical protein